MKKLVLLLCLIASPVLLPNLIAQDSAKANDSTKANDSAKLQPVAADVAPKGERHEFVMANFHTENGVTLPQARVVYGTYGQLNGAGDNVVLLPSYYMDDFHGYEWLIGSARALNYNAKRVNGGDKTAAESLVMVLM